VLLPEKGEQSHGYESPSCRARQKGCVCLYWGLFWAVFRVKTRAAHLCMLGKRSTAELHPTSMPGSLWTSRCIFTWSFGLSKSLCCCHTSGAPLNTSVCESSATQTQESGVSWDDQVWNGPAHLPTSLLGGFQHKANIIKEVHLQLACGQSSTFCSVLINVMSWLLRIG
jgi:hypothetical protein